MTPMKTMTALLALVVLACLGATPALAQAAPAVNPSQLQWTAPTTNADGTPLTDLALYRVRIAGPLTNFVACPAYSPIAYSLRSGSILTAASPAPAANTLVSFGLANAKAFATTVGVTVDGTYCAAVSAVDLSDNEGGGSATVPFERNTGAPGVPTAPVFK